MNFDNMKALLDKFCIMAQESHGHVDLEQFAQYLDMPISEPLRQMFELYDRVSKYWYIFIFRGNVLWDLSFFLHIMFLSSFFFPKSSTEFRGKGKPNTCSQIDIEFCAWW